MQPGDEIRSLSITPDKYLTVRYAGASGDYNPIHIDEEFARQVGLPGRILHGLWTMAQVARAQAQDAGDPLALESLSVQFRGLGMPEREIVVTSSTKEDIGGRCRVSCEVLQGEARLVRRGVAVVRTPPS